MQTTGHELTLRQIQLATLKILKQIIQICEDQGLTYYLAYGSLIGAVRHHGFIPWDDDLDICMPRPDFNKFLAYFDDESHDTGTLRAIHNKPGHLLPFLIARISDTAYREIGSSVMRFPKWAPSLMYILWMESVTIPRLRKSKRRWSTI
ncbi:LicD family protein [Bifidobacterium sp. ESL0682]|uniref:LicD family protein n=1 Tax=Bifidobacterium sp. ESL0682 TaxID=2983212 RepID=UPI0023F80EA3|nr:LicD family protein [Bifidobacterium sp. ESL0682]WEV42231.1 LicD family protein [Bifidobacterium sp. ESL0682]